MRSLKIFIFITVFSIAKANPNDSGDTEFLASGLFIKGNDASFRGDCQTAAKIFKDVVELRPQDIYLKKKLASELICIGKLKEAEKILEAVFNKSQDNSSGLILAGVYASLKKPDKARSIYQKIINSNNDAKVACLSFVKSISVEKNYIDNLVLLAKCEKKNKNDPAFAFFRGNIEYDRGHKAQAIKYLKDSLRIDHSYSQSALALGAIYEEKRDLKAAVKTYKDFLAVDGNSTNLPVLSSLVTILFSMKENTIVIPYAETLAALDNTDLNLKVHLGLLYSDSGRFENAINTFKEILSEVPDSYKVIYYLGILNQKTHHYQESIEFFKRIPASSILYGEAKENIKLILGTFAREVYVQGKKAP